MCRADDSPDSGPVTLPALRVLQVAAADARVRAAAAVLAGEPPEQVARWAEVDVEQVLRWSRCLAEGGAAAVAGVGVERPSRGTRVVAEDYLQVVAHELRTPLTAARSALSLLGRDDIDLELRRQVSRVALGRLEAMDRLASDLVDTVAITTGQQALSPEPVELQGPLRQACEQAGVAAPGTSLVVSADPVRLRQVLRVLLEHARRYAPVERVSVGVRPVQGYALLTVRLAGVVQTREQAEALLEPFDASRGDGNGLSLYIVRALVVAAGGSVGMAGSARSHGADTDATVLWVRLPLTVPTPGEEPS